MGVNLDPNAFNKAAEIAKNITRVAANVTDPNNKPKPQQEKKTENMNQPHTQTVEVKVGEQNPAQKPTIIKEKSETHVHKVFPDQRELSERECNVRELELRNEHEYKMEELHWRMQMEAENRKERKERDERDRKEREERRQRDRKFARNLGIGLGAVGVVTVGLAIYDYYTNSRNPKIGGGTAREPQAVNAIPAEGTVS